MILSTKESTLDGLGVKLNTDPTINDAGEAKILTEDFGKVGPGVFQRE